MSRAQRLRTAYHEAGHAVALMAQGIPLISVTISPTLDGSSNGKCRYHPRQESARSIFRAGFAGLHASRLIENTPDCFGDHDRERCIAIGRRYGILPDLDSLESIVILAQLDEQAARLVQRYKHLISAVARQLLRMETMDHADVARVMRRHHGINR